MALDGQDVYFVVFAVGDQRHGIDLERVVRVLPAVEITPLAGAPGVIDGIINVHGTIVPVLNTHRRVGLMSRDMDLGDQLLLVQTAGRQLVLVTDSISGVVLLPRKLVERSGSPSASLEFVEAAVHVADGALLIDNVDRLLNKQESQQLDKALASGTESRV
jgi:purine-binding chemotaxis protein CheW